MYRILLADDEKIVVDSLSIIINRNFPNQFEILKARTGRAVIELAEQYHPDVAIVDIQMPGINGIHAIKEVVKDHSNIIFIIMTAYDRFDYAKEAVSLGVYEYMNKPFNNKDIVDVLNRVIRVIESRRKKLSDSLKVQEKMEAVTPIIENGFIYSMLFSGSQSAEDIYNYKRLLELEADYGCMMSFAMGEEQKEGQLTNAVGSSVRLQQSYPIVRDRILKSWPGAIVGTVISNRIPVFLPLVNKKQDYEERILMIEEGRKLCRDLRKETDCRFRIGIGSVVDMKDSMISYEEAMRALAASDGSVAHVADLPLQCEYDEEYPVELEKNLFSALKNGNVDSCEYWAGQFFDWMLASFDQKNMNVRMKILEFVFFAEREAFLSGGITYHFNDRGDYMPLVYNAERNGDLKPWFVERFSTACRHINSKKQNYENRMITKGKEYIQSNYSRDISLDDVSRYLNLSPYYFSKLFKSETGITFVEYLTELRIRQAKELLKDEKLSVKEICVSVGYSDPNYFSRIFKKNLGMTPTEFREEHKHEQ